MADTPASDLMLGQLAIRSGRITTDQLEECLAEQQALLARGAAAAPRLGALLTRKGYLSEGAVQELLAAQASARDVPPARPEDVLAAARFGERLVARGLATTPQVEDALRCQMRLTQRGVPLRLGEILVSRGVLAAAEMERALVTADGTLLHCARCNRSFKLRGSPSARAVTCPTCHGLLAPLGSAAPAAAAPASPAAPAPAPAPVPAPAPAPLPPRIPTPAPAPGAASGSPPAEPGAPFGRYHLLKELGRGGMGVVYQAWDTDLKRVVALKTLLPDAVPNSDEVERFFREARAAGRLRHPNIVPVHEVGTWQNRHYFVMDFIEGESLESAKRRLSLRKFLEVLRDVARALHAAHEQGIIHRDVKQANILLDAAGRPYVSDFGVAKEMGSGTLRRLTVTGSLIGTPQYMSPEQADGQVRAIGPWSDVWSLGVILYEKLAGILPFRGNNIAEMLNAIFNEDPPAPSSVAMAGPGGRRAPRDLETICLKCLRKEPRQRYQSAADLAADLGRYLAGEPIQARALGATEKALIWCRRRPAVVGAVMAAATVVAIACLMVTRQRGLEDELAELRTRLARTTDAAERQEIERRIAERTATQAPAPARLPLPESRRPPSAAQPSTAPAPDTAADPSLPAPRPAPAKLKWHAVAERVRELAGRGEYGQALSELAAFEPGSAEERGQAEKEQGSVRADAQSAYAKIDAAAQELAARGQFEDARRAYDAVAAFGVPELADRARQAMDRIEAARADAARAALAGRLRAVQEKVAALCKVHKYEPAAQEVSAERARTPALAQDLDSLLNLVKEVAALIPAVRRGALALKGQTLRLDLGTGEVRDGTEHEIRLFLKDLKGEVSVPYVNLGTRDLEALARAGGAGPEAIGLLWLFEGRFDQAREAWKQSPRSGELETLAAALGAMALEQEAQSALDTLLAAAARKDWRRCRELLAQGSRYRKCPSWVAAAPRIEEIEDAAAEVVEEPIYAVAPRRTRAGLEWSYDFSSAAQLRDWRLACSDLWPVREAERLTGAGAHVESKALYLRGTQLDFLAPLEGDARILARLSVPMTAKPASSPGLTVGGYQWTCRAGARTTLRAPSGAVVATAVAPELEKGRACELQLRLAAGTVRAFVDGREVVQAPLSEPPRMLPPGIVSDQDTELLIQGVVVSGTPRRGWPAVEKERRTLLAGLDREGAFGPKETLTDGTSLGKCRTAGNGTWEVSGRVLRATVPAGGPGDAELIATCPARRNFRMRLKYCALSTVRILLDVREGGTYPLTYHLPLDRPGHWRELEVVAVESALACTLDGAIVLSPSREADLIGEGVPRLRVEEGKAEVAELTLEEVRKVPASDWTEIYDGRTLRDVRPGANWSIGTDTISYRGYSTGHTLVGAGELQTSGQWKDLEARFRLDCRAHARIRVAVRGDYVLDYAAPSDGPYTFELLAKGDLLESAVNELAQPQVKLKPGAGPFKISTGGDEVKLHFLRVRQPR